MEPAIEATGLTKSYGEVRVLAGVDLHVPRGSVFALLGPNGAGKTTAVRILATLTEPDGGTARVAGHDIMAGRALVRRSISLTGQDTALDELQTGAENLRMMGRLCRLSARRAAERRLDLTLADDAVFDALAAYLGHRALLSDRDRRTLSVATDGSAANVRSLLDELDPDRRAIDTFAVHSATLDDVFLALTGHLAKETAGV